MSFFEISYNTEQQKAFNYFEEIGVVMETVIMSSGEPEGDIYHYSKTAAIKGMEILADRHAKWFRKTNPGLNIEDYFRIKILPGEELTGEEITFAGFMGNQLDLHTGTFRLPGQGTGKQNDGFVYAFLNPPYGLKTGNESHNETLATYLETMLNIKAFKNIGHLKFFSWSDNWSNYFDAGKEWWGTFCWTVYNSKNNTITFIAASSTD